MSTIDGSGVIGVGTVSATEVDIGRAGHTTKLKSDTNAITGTAQFLDSGDARSVSLVAPSTQSASVTYTLPTAPTTVGQALTSTAGGLMSWAVGGGSSPFRYVVSPTSPYTTIQAAITQAVSDGAANGSPAIIWVTEGTYTGNITLSDGIYVIGAPAFGFNLGATTVRANLTAPPANGASTNMAVKLTGQIIVTQTNTTAATPNTINCGLAYVQLNYDTVSTNLFQFSSQSGGGNAGAAIRFFLEQCYGAFSNVSLFGFTGNNDTTGSVTVDAQGCAFTYIATVAGTAQWFNLDSTCTVGGSFHSFRLNVTDCIFTLNKISNAFAFGILTIVMSRCTVSSSNQTTPTAGTLFTHTSAGSMNWTFTDSTISSTPINTATTQILISHTGTGALSITGTRSSLSIGASTTASFNGTLLQSVTNASAITNLVECANLPPANPMYSGHYFIDLSSNTYAGGSLIVSLVDCATQPQTNGTDTQWAGLDIIGGANNQEIRVINLSVASATFNTPSSTMDMYINAFVKKVTWTWSMTTETATTSPTSLIGQNTVGPVAFRFPNSSMTYIHAEISAGNATYGDTYTGRIIAGFGVNSTATGTLSVLNTLSAATSTASAAIVSPFAAQSFYFDVQGTAPSASSYFWSAEVKFITTTSVGGT
jgi:hypothetical protein